MTDEELTRAYIQYVDMVFRIALVMTKNRADAEDIQQDVFLALVRYSYRIQSEKHLKAWLIRVTKNACRKHFRTAISTAIPLRRTADGGKTRTVITIPITKSSAGCSAARCMNLLRTPPWRISLRVLPRRQEKRIQPKQARTSEKETD